MGILVLHYAWDCCYFGVEQKMNLKNILRRLYCFLPENEYEVMKDYLFELQKQRFKRLDTRVLREIPLAIRLKPKTYKMVYDYLIFLLMTTSC